MDDGVFIERHKASRLAAVLPEQFLRKHFSTIDTEALADYERALDTVHRWKDADHDKYTVHESVLDHVIGILELIQDIEKKYPELTRALDIEAVRLMAILHDAGETLRGDVPASVHRQDAHTDLHKKAQGIIARRKDSELKWSRRLIKKLRDETTRNHLADLVHREQTRAPDDREAHIMKFLDLARDLRFGTDYVFPVRRAHGHSGYRGTGQSWNAESYAARCTSVLQSLGSDESAKRAFAQLAGERMFSVLQENGMPEDDMQKLRQSVAI